MPAKTDKCVSLRGEPMAFKAWEGPDSPLARYLVDSNHRSLQSYSSKPEWLEEHAHIEESIAEGGYGHRQVYELVQNGADAMVRRAGGRIEVILTDSHLYCANEGDPIDQSGLEVLLGSNMSRKRGDEIGRFGLGFKSVLAVTDQPEFFSRPVSLRFSDTFTRDQVENKIKLRQGTPLPILRLGEPLDPEAEAASDPVLSDLMSWAETVVRLKRANDRDTSWLAADLAEFPSQFLLFTRHVSDLTLDDRVAGIKRVIQVQRGGEEVRLLEGTSDQRWRVFRRVVAPTAAARKDAGARAERDRLPIDWAVPTSGPSTIGKFWAFFPTTFETTLSGILNAPWKTNPDRENLLKGPFNEYLLDVAAELVVDNLHNVSSAADPSKHIDRMPARGREARGWADRRITERIYALAAERESLPDQRGHLALPANLRLHPEKVPVDALELWSSYDFRPHRWVHATADTRERRPRVERLLEAARNGGTENSSVIASYTEWLEALATTGTPEASAAALSVAELLKSQISPFDFEEVKAARIVLTTSGELVPPDRDQLFIGGHPAGNDSSQVDPRLIDGSFVERVLRETFAITDVDRSAELSVYMANQAQDPDYWPTVWSRIDGIPDEQAKELILRHHAPGEVSVRTLAGDFRPLGSVLLAGAIVDAAGSDPEFTVDEHYHSAVLDLLRDIGATDRPHTDRADFDGGPKDWYDTYLQFVRDTISASEGPPPANALVEADHSEIPSHLELLPHLSDGARARMTTELLRVHPEQHVWSWRRAPSRMSPVATPSPSMWFVQEHGMVMTSLGLRPVSAAVSAALASFSRILPVIRLSSEATAGLAIADRIEECPAPTLEEGLARLASETDDEVIGRYVSAISKMLPPPEMLCCRVGANHDLRPTKEITVISNIDIYQQIRSIESPTILAPAGLDADLLVANWGLRREGDLITTEIGYQLWAPEVLLIEEFPALRMNTRFDEHRSVSLMRCSDLTRTVRSAAGQTSTAVDRAVDNGRIYWLVKDTDDPNCDDGELLSFISARLCLGLSETQIQALLQNRKDEAHRKHIEQIREQPDDVSRLLLCLGAEKLRRYVPASLIHAIEEQGHSADDRMIAEMALAVHGVDVLREAKSDLEVRGLAPPIHWSGGRTAQEFVRDLGFPREFAGFPEDQLDQVLEAMGPVELKPLHDFQAVVSEKFRDLLRCRDSTKRAMLSLPTGAGKTRVAVQSLVEHLRDGEIDGPVLWIAQSEELCEQAVQAWAEVWRAMGPPRMLTISRLWDDNVATAVPNQPHVVIATVQKLNRSVVEVEEYEWLSKAAAVVIDEAHRGAASRSTTALLRWLGLESGGNDRCPLVGLTATPFIGANKEHTEVLVRRYGHNRLDAGIFPQGDTEQLISLLQERRILSRAIHSRIDGVDIDLDDRQLAELDQFQRLPRSIEAELGSNASRNATLVNSIGSQPADWQILVFAASVENAQTLAALLRLNGVSAAAVTADTRPGARRYYIQKFKDREIRVLTNYGTLTTGFDAPEVRAVYVARPTYSPNLYLQMIGRGLRGPANGGTEECLIVDVEDNVRMYGGKLAFTDFEFLWSEHASV